VTESGLNLWGGLSLGLAWSIIIGLCLWCFLKVIRLQRAAELAPATSGRGHWATRTGLILAMAGNAIGLGNFLRFPVKAAANGGGAFLIPYFCALIFLGVPLMWAEWGIGRYGGSRGHGSTPGMFELMWRHPLAKYLGALGIALPFAVACFYCFIESWTLGYAFFSASGAFTGQASREIMAQFLKGYQGVEQNQFFSSVLPAVLFLAATLAINYFFLSRGVARGIEVLARYGMPLLFIFAVALVVRVLFLGAPDPLAPQNSVAAGLGYLWNPDFSQLGRAEVWLVAAGQIFFTLSLGQGMINTYASYLKQDQDVVLNGLTTTLTNELAEVVLGATIAIPAAVAFFGLAETREIAKAGAFDLGFVTMPVIFQKIPLGALFSTMWFGLLSIAGCTSSVAMLQPVIAFLQDELGWSRRRAVNSVFAALALCLAAVVGFFKYGFLDELDFWAGTFGLALFAVIEIIVFSWIFGVEKGWDELHRGADLRAPGFFRWVLKYLTPVYLLVLLVAWTVQAAWERLIMQGEAPENHPYLWGARLLFLLIVATSLLMVGYAWRRKAQSRERLRS
jgi:NSS family neurotransmitter:Na+ symporter